MPAPAVELEFARDVSRSLSKTPQRELPSLYLYDAIGSALFETITLLPEYGLTRADERLLRRHADAILDWVASPVVVAELGSGSGRKTRWILEALARREPVEYYPIDISQAALDRCRYELAALAPAAVVGLEQPYLDGLGEVASRREEGRSLLVLFLGSTIGNFDPPAAVEFLGEIRRRLAPGDALLLGTDLVKEVPRMILAYDDPAGVTAAFNRNILGRINRELGADFNLRGFAHEARWNEAERRIEMHLRSEVRQTVTVPAAGFCCAFEAGETIWTESCHKFLLEEIPPMAQRAGFTCEAQWVDGEWPFVESLWVAR